MNKTLLLFILLAASTVTFAQETYRCTINGVKLIQDQPCPGSVRRSQSMPNPNAVPAASPDGDQRKRSAEQAREKLDRDIANMDAVVKRRIFERERDEAAFHLRECEGEVASMQQQINSLANSSRTNYVSNLAGLSAMQLEEERRQTQIAGLQSQITAKRRECDWQSAEYNRKFRGNGQQAER